MYLRLRGNLFPIDPYLGDIFSEATHFFSEGTFSTTAQRDPQSGGKLLPEGPAVPRDPPSGVTLVLEGPAVRMDRSSETTPLIEAR